MSRHLILNTAQIVDYFTAGLTVQELSIMSGQPILKIEQAIRRWMILWPAGKPSPRTQVSPLRHARR